MGYQNDIQKIIEKALIEKTFSLEIIEKIKELSGEFENSQKENLSLEERLNKARDLYSETQNNLSDARAKIEYLEVQLKEWREREKEIEGRELRFQFEGMEKHYLRQRGDEFKELFKALTNSVTVTTVSKQIPAPPDNPYPNMINTYETVTTKNLSGNE